jgi:hypothetical protein
MKNPMMNVNQVDVNMQFTLSGDGQIISETARIRPRTRGQTSRGWR